MKPRPAGVRKPQAHKAARAQGAIDWAGVGGAIAAWFEHNARDLPWRVEVKTAHSEHSPARGAGVPGRNPYHALVAEAMLQQTQVSRVVGKFSAFVAKFPDVQALALAREGDVLSMWDGLGYYRRARSLHAAARAIVERHSGRVPHRVDELLDLPGIGRYTAGAIASIAFDERVPLVDGNVARVLLRVSANCAKPEEKATQAWLWGRALDVVNAAGVRPALINEGLMELGATVCLPAPASPRCDECPLKNVCSARAQGRQLEIPPPKARAFRKTVYCATLIVSDRAGRVAIERRAARGMWQGLWQMPTIERDDRAANESEVAAFIGLKQSSIKLVESFEFLATHRRMRFDVWRVRKPASAREAATIERGREFVGVADALARGVSSPQKRALAIAAR